MVPVLVIVGFTVLASRRGSIQHFEIFRAVAECIAILSFILFRYSSAPDRAPRILELVKRPARSEVPIPFREMAAPLFEPPKNWRVILSLPRPRKLKSSLTKQIAFAIIGLLAGAGAWIALSVDYNSYPIDRGLWILFGLFWFVFLVRVFVTSIRHTYQARGLLRDGEVTIGWITDAWETGGDVRKIHVTVQFRDLVGLLLEHDFVLRRIDDSADPGHPALVFYDSLHPERCTISAATTLQLAEDQPLSAGRAG